MTNDASRLGESQSLTLSYQQTWTLLGISRSTFFQLLKQGRFDHLRAPLPRKFSKARVEAFVNNTPMPGTRPWRAQ